MVDHIMMRQFRTYYSIIQLTYCVVVLKKVELIAMTLT